MPIYTFNICNSEGVAFSFEAHQLRYDGETFAKAGAMLEQHPTCDHVEVWQGVRGVLARYRFQPVIRPIEACA